MEGGDNKSRFHVPTGFIPLKIAGCIMLIIALIFFSSGLGVLANGNFVSGAIVTFIGLCLGYGGYRLVRGDK